MLTERQREVVLLICDGLSNEEIATKLHVCRNSVKYHLQCVYRKLGFPLYGSTLQRLELLKWAVREGVYDPKRETVEVA